jgi:hypothetical protein
MSTEYPTIAVELDGFADSPQHVPEQRVPWRRGHSHRCKCEQRRVMSADVFLLVRNHELLL